MFNLKKSQVGKRDCSPLLRLLFTHTGVKEKSGDKSLFPTFDFFMFGEKNRFLPSKSAAQNGQTPARAPPLISRVRNAEFGMPDHAVVLGGNANRILVTIGIND